MTTFMALPKASPLGVASALAKGFESFFACNPAPATLFAKTAIRDVDGLRLRLGRVRYNAASQDGLASPASQWSTCLAAQTNINDQRVLISTEELIPALIQYVLPDLALNFQRFKRGNRPAAAAPTTLEWFL